MSAAASESICRAGKVGWFRPAFPLTPALSRREREERVKRSVNGDAPEFGKAKRFVEPSGPGCTTDSAFRIPHSANS